jgi:uncharacterized phage-associated protein
MCYIFREGSMPAANDIASYIESQLGSVSAYKLQKLVYYAQAWSIAWTRLPLFPDAIKAWQDGPVVPCVWQARKNGERGDAEALGAEHRATVDAVLAFYGSLEANQLIDLSHREAPWRNARIGVAPDESSTREITIEAMRTYYAPLCVEGEKRVPPGVMQAVSFQLAVPEGELDQLGEVDDSVEADDVARWLNTGRGDPWDAPSA